MIFAYIWGVTYDPAPYVEFLRSRNIDIIEDCAQSFKSLDVFKGSPYATMTMFSFGMIKNNTAFYGAVSVIREESNVSNLSYGANLYIQMSQLQDTYNLYSTKEYAKKIGTAFAMWNLLNSEFAFKSSMKYYRMMGKDVENELISKMRGFAADADFLGKFRVKPNAALIAMIHYRTSKFKKADFEKRVANYWRVINAVTEAGNFVPGQ